MSFTGASSAFVSALFQGVRERLREELRREPTTAEVCAAFEIENDRYGQEDMPCKKK